MTPQLKQQQELIAKIQAQIRVASANAHGALLATANGEGAEALLRMAHAAGLGIEASHAAQYLREQLLTQDPGMLAQVRMCAALASHTLVHECVMILGESGTGKETFARAFAAGGLPFVAINCTSLPDYLVESELFGHKRGAFTGAVDDRVGLFIQAGRGVLFIDEIGDMPMTMQAKLLRVLQDRKVRPVGANIETEIACRVVCATHRDPKIVLRNDLYWRLCTHTIALTPLRERVEDVRLYIQTHAAGLLSDNDIANIIALPLNGNYRELQSIIARKRVEKVLSITGTPPAP